jgi:hypothetical protein
MGFDQIMSETQLHLLKEMAICGKSIKSRYFALGREFDKFVKLADKIWGSDDPRENKKVQI